MQKKLLVCLFVLCGWASAYAQLPSQQLRQQLGFARRDTATSSYPLFTRSAATATYPTHQFQASKEQPTTLTLNPQALNQLVDEQPSLLTFSIPTATGSIDLELIPVELYSATSKLLVGTPGGTVEAPYDRGTFYQGFIKGKPESLVAISITNGVMSGLVADATGSYALGAQRNVPNGYLFYNDNTLAANRPFVCTTEEPTGPLPASSPGIEKAIGCKVVSVYFEADNKLYVDNGSSVNQTADYVANLFNQVAVLYARENVAIRLAGVKVWATPDPYVSFTNTATLLPAYRDEQNNNPPPGVTFDLSELLSGRSIGGGRAYLNVICNSTDKYGVSGGLAPTYNEFASYAWEVNVVAHEMGHNFGSPHTHSCTWPGGAIDNCYTTEGGCLPGPAPINGGTIMSYCHVTPTGINFANGFGPLPGQRLRDRVTACASLSVANDVPTSLGVKALKPTAATVYWASNSGSTQFTIQYRISSGMGWTTVGPFAGQRYTLTGLQPNTAYTWRVTGECSATYSAEASFTTGAPVYCTPVYQNNGCNFGIGLKSVRLNATALTTNSGCAATYFTYYSTPVGSVSISAANSFTIDLLGYFNPQSVAIWIDTDRSYEFDASELVYISPASTSTLITGTFNLPANAQAGQTYRMRVRNKLSTPSTIACESLSYGETEDYLVTVAGGCPPTPNLTVSATAISCQQSSTLTVANCPGTLAWSSGTPSGNSIVVMPTQTTTYTVTCTQAGCSSSQQATVNVAPNMVSVQSGNWDNPAVWSCQRVPSVATPLVIGAGHLITLPQNVTGFAQSVRFLGQVRYLTNSRIRFTP